MIKILRFLVICAFGVVALASSMARAQTYTAVNYPAATATELAGGPNPQGTSVGIYTDSSGFTHGFTYTAKSVYTSFDPPGSTSTSPNFIAPQGTIVGSYVDSGGVLHGFILSGGTYTTVNYPGAAGTFLSGINPSGEISGGYCTTGGCPTSTFHSFTLSKMGGVFTSFDPPGAASSETSVVLPSGAVVGSYTTISGGTCFTQCFGYMLYMGKYATINYPGSTFTFAGGANAEGNIVGIYDDTSFVGHGFLFNGAYTSFDYPGAIFTEATGINPAGVICGVYLDSSFNEHGFIRTP